MSSTLITCLEISAFFITVTFLVQESILDVKIDNAGGEFHGGLLVGKHLETHQTLYSKES